MIFFKSCLNLIT